MGPLARLAPRPRTGGLAGGMFRSPDRSAGVFPVKTLLIALNGLPAFLAPRSPAAGPVGGPQPFGDDGTVPWGALLEPRGPLGAFGMLVWRGGPFDGLPSMFTSLLGCTPAGSDAAGPVGVAVGVEGCG